MKNYLRQLNCSSAAIALMLLTASPAAAESPPIAVTEAPLPAQTNAWGQSSGDIVPDPALILGTLPNGMKYAIKRNATPKGGASVRFAFDVGFAAEGDEDEGLSHFIEHMAFNGSKNIPEGELVKKLERLGLAFGADTNASTNVDLTTYILEIPAATDETMDDVLMIMRETASELTFSKAAIDRERGILFSEKQTRNYATRRHLRNWFQSTLPDTPIGKRLSSGSEDVLKNAGTEQLSAYYRKFYRPDKATLVVTGDIDPRAIEVKIKSRFSDWKPVGPAGEMDMGTVNPDAPASFVNFVDPTATDMVKLTRMLPYAPSLNTIADEKQSYLQNLGSMILSSRLNALATAPDTKVLGGLSQLEDLFETAQMVGMLMIVKDGDWKSALVSSEQELRRALEFGFTQSELDQALAVLDAGARNAVSQKDGTPSSGLADALIRSAQQGFVFSTPEAELALYQKLLPELTVDNVNTAFRAMWGGGPNVVHISTKSEIADAEKTIAAAMAESKAVAVAAPVEAIVSAFAYDDFGKAGKVKQDKRIADLGIRTIGFANGSLLNIKRTDFEPGKIRFVLRAGSGRAVLPPDQPGLDTMLDILSRGDGLGKHDALELQKIVTGKTVSVGVNAAADSFSSAGVTTPADLELQLKLLAAQMTDFGYRPETQAQWPSVAQLIATQIDSNPSAMAQSVVPNLLANGDVRVGLADPASLAARNMEQLKAAIDQDLKNGPVEIALVGDVDEAAAIALVAKTFGALPKRGKAKPVTSLPGMSFATDRTLKILTHKGPVDQGVIAFAWPTTDDSDLKAFHIRNVLGGVLRLKLIEVVREKLGATYTPSPLMESSDVYAGFGYFGALMVAEPDKMQQVADAVKVIVAELRNNAVSEDLLLRARKPSLEQFAKQDRENSGWTYVTSVAQNKPDRLDRRRKRIAVLESVTAADVQKAAQTYLTDDGLFEIRIINEKVVNPEASTQP